MRFFIDYLSGNVPGGFLALFFILFTVNVALYYLYKSSKLFDRTVYRSKLLRYNILILSLYIFFWVYLRPPGVPDTLIFMPLSDGNHVDPVYAEVLQEYLADGLEKDCRLYRWEWLYQSSVGDSFAMEDYRLKQAEKLGLKWVLYGRKISGSDQSTEFEYSIRKNGSRVLHKQFSATSVADAVQQIRQMLKTAGDIIRTNKTLVVEGDYTYWRTWSGAKLALAQGRYEQLPEILQPMDRRTKTLLSEYYLYKGKQLTEKEKSTSLQTEDKNPHFQRVLSWLVPYGREEKDDAAMNLILGRVYLRKKNYGMAEVCLKRALTQDHYNSRIYYYLSFLHPTRIQELGFKNRISLLEQTVRLDPGYAEAVYELANDLYTGGTAAASAHSTQKALKLMNEFLAINSTHPKILSLLGRVYLQSKFTLKAHEIFGKLVDLYPDSAENFYNLGVTNYQLKNFEQAEQNFRDALKINDYLEAYLYLGAIYRQREEYGQALYYFRERIKRKTADDDHYAKEAMRQVRIILDILADSTAGEESNEIQTPGN